MTAAVGPAAHSPFVIGRPRKPGAIASTGGWTPIALSFVPAGSLRSPRIPDALVGRE